MRVGLIVTGGVDRRGIAVIPALEQLIDALATRVSLTVVALHFEETPCTYLRGSVPIWDLGTRRVPTGARRWVQRRRLAAWSAVQPRCDVWHAWWGVPAGWVATQVAATRQIPVVVTASSGEFTALSDIKYGLQRRWIDRRLIAATMTRATVVTVPTRYMATLATAAQVETTIVPHGVAAAAPWRPLPEGPVRLIQVAHLNAVKDHDTTLRAFADVVRTIPSAHLDVVGEDTRGGTVQALAQQLGVGDRVTFHGRCTTAQTAALVARAHLHVQSSRHEAGGVAVLEAAAHSVPTVGTNVGYVADWASEAAVAVPVGDASALGRAVIHTLHNPARHTALARAAHARAQAMTMDAMAEAFVRVYHAASHTRSPGSSTA